jgi:AraC-like DNA-binding protein
LGKDGGLAGLVTAYLDGLAKQVDSLDERETDVVADNVCRLLAVASGAAAGEHKESIRVARLDEEKRYIEARLADPTLTPETAAKALKVSVRQLHLVFEPSGTSFGQYVLRRRLEECRTARLNSIVDRSVTDVTFAWGFSSLATFYRAFQQAFGAAPDELRAEERGRRPSTKRARSSPRPCPTDCAASPGEPSCSFALNEKRNEVALSGGWRLIGFSENAGGTLGT